uniref:Omp-1-15 n=1 Tax=Ehrlichia ewingii TaxID=947 RepID=B1N6B8_9RICK|nr:Omp-1-15 [Ehrlichia ewingii]
MNCKKIFITSALMSLVSFIPCISFSNPMQDNNIVGNFYVSGKYMPTISHFDNFSAKEDTIETIATFGLSKTYNRSSPIHSDFTDSKYSFKYENNPFLGFAGAVGYSMEGLRLEFEISYEKFDVKNPDNSYSNGAHMYYALSRKDNANIGTTPQDKKYVYIKNEGLTDISLMLNACYDVISEGISFVPYICAGIGSDFISMFDITSPKLSYQGKLGISYSINPEMSVFIGGHFHKVIGDQFKDITPLKPNGIENTTATHVLVTLHMCHFGAEIGGRFTF